jgi:protein TonB
MNTLGLHPEYKPKDPSRRMVGIGVVTVLHLLVGYAVVTGSARTAFEMVKKPLQAVLVEEVIIPPPPPPPPPKEIVKQQEAPKVEAPPPPFVPPPDVPPPVTSTAPAIQSVATPPPAPAVIAPPPPPAPPPVVVPPVPSGPTRSDMKVACPSQVAPEMPRKALQDGTQGVVKAQALIRNGAVVEVTVLSGPKVFHEPVRKAMLQYKCLATSGEVLATQEFAFKIED